jgi:ferric-dicitrate binding protein FerR (iron transport regulator)
MKAIITNIGRRTIAMVLCLLLCPFDLLVAQVNAPAPGQPAGEIMDLTGGTMRNSTPAQAKEQVLSNDFLVTNQTGRMRVALKDGSTVNLGSDTALKVLRHDARSRQTTLQLVNGRVRSRVQHNKSAVHFEVTTPHGTVSAVGTDFYVDVANPRTLVIVYSGIVLVKPLHSGGAVDAAAGQSVEVTSSGISPLRLTPEDIEHSSLAQTALPGDPELHAAASAEEQERTGAEPIPAITTATLTKPPRSRSHTKLILGLLIGGAAAGVAAGLASSSGNNTPEQPTAARQPIPAR